MMDGPLKPNTALDEALVVLKLPALDNLTAGIGRPGLQPGCGADADPRLGRRVASFGGTRLLQRDHLPGGRRIRRSGDRPDGQGITIHGGRHDGVQIKETGGAALRAPSAALFLDPDTLVVANGSAEFMMADWKRDLMNRRASGSVWRIALGRQGPRGDAAGAQSRLSLWPGARRGRHAARVGGLAASRGDPRSECRKAAPRHPIRSPGLSRADRARGGRRALAGLVRHRATS